MIFPAGLDTPATVTTTGCLPAGTDIGTVKLICAVPTKPGVIPRNGTIACTPPTVTDTGSIGLGKLANAVPAVGDQALLSCGETSPTPVA